MGLLQALMCRSEADLKSPFAKFICLALGLLFMGKQDLVDATLGEKTSIVTPLPTLSPISALKSHRRGLSRNDLLLLLTLFFVLFPLQRLPRPLQTLFLNSAR